jgi:hypothetical protein
MNKEVVLQLIREEAARLPLHASYEQMVSQLADLLSESRGRLSRENFDQLVALGAALYKAGHSQFHARKDVAELMDKSVTDRRAQPS